ncbi:MAG: GtrA family protein [Pontiellaceae bacterium]|nr:GtrA family protein [Pontiellaceae bacterium]MBN2786025.1 GtrA family protein [Pontiellaceae bacterium]
MDIVKKILQEKDHPILQFAKYMICGGLAFAVDYLVFNFSAIRLFPALQPGDFIAEFLNLNLVPIDEYLQIRNYWICMSLGFVFSNVVAYVTNVLFVFKGGKHKIYHEVALFFGVSLVAFLLSTITGHLLIHFMDAQTSVSKIVAIVFAVLINYSGRKFFIFHG